MFAAAGGVLFFFLVVLKLIVRWTGARGMPCPSSLSWLVDNPLRRWFMRPVLDRLDVHPGDTVLEVGPGPGAFTIDAAQRAGSQGTVFAVDIQPEMIAKLKRRLYAADVHNVETRVASACALPIDDATIDRAFLVTVLPEIPDPVRALKEIHRTLKPGGRLSVTEQFSDPHYPFPSTTIRWAETAGFKQSGRHGSFWIYTLNFEKS
jgi:ubiquinone/menaquinone biosynthesis C-methylase UbiE